MAQTREHTRVGKSLCLHGMHNRFSWSQVSNMCTTIVQLYDLDLCQRLRVPRPSVSMSCACSCKVHYARVIIASDTCSSPWHGYMGGKAPRHASEACMLHKNKLLQVSSSNNPWALVL